MGSFSMFLPAFSVVRSLLHSCNGGKMVWRLSMFSWVRMRLNFSYVYLQFFLLFSKTLGRIFVCFFFFPTWLLVLLISSTLYTSNINPFWDYILGKSSSKFQVYAFVFLLVLASHKLSFTFMYSWTSIIVFLTYDLFQKAFLFQYKKV